MGKDREVKAALPAANPPIELGPDGKPKRPPKGHRQKGAGTVITAKPAFVTNDGVVLKAHERLPSTLLMEYCQKEQRPKPKYLPSPHSRSSDNNNNNNHRL